MRETGFDPLRWWPRDLLIGCTGVGLLFASLMDWYSARWQAGSVFPAGHVAGNGWTTSDLWTASVVLGLAVAVLWLYHHGRHSVPRWVVPVSSTATLVAVILFGWQWFTLPEQEYVPPDDMRQTAIVTMVSTESDLVNWPVMAVDRAGGGGEQGEFSSEIGLGCQLAALALVVQLAAVLRRRQLPPLDGHQSGAP